MNKRLISALNEMPIICILRGLKPSEALEVAQGLYEAGIRIMEVPLNSPEAFKSIAMIKEKFGTSIIVGAGTVLTVEEVDRLKEAGGEIVVSPNTDPAVIERSLKHGMVPMPGFATATEAFLAYRAGARHLKLFPAATYGIDHLRALKAVLPTDASILAVGGIGLDNATQWFKAGITGIGTGSSVYRPGDTASTVHEKALKLTLLLKSN